ncbi:MAG: UDP-glucose 4-epimerase GalE [Clostridia bacterium]
MRILVTGGTGYIGSHTVLELVAAGHDVIIADNYSNSKPESMHRICELAGRSIPFELCELCDRDAVIRLFDAHDIDAVIHFAGLKAVGESVKKPLLYYQNNILSTLNLLFAMQVHGVHGLVFSSSATVYGAPSTVPIRENSPTNNVTSPYGRTKLMIEDILRDIASANADMSVVLLRYFNPVGAHPSGRIGEDPNGVPNNLMPYIARVAVGKLEMLPVYGNDYPTPDGTGVRDYIHVVDLAAGHVAALQKLDQPGVYTYNLGTGIGCSVLEVIEAYRKASGQAIPYQIMPRRPGDVPAYYADSSLAYTELGWKAQRSLYDMCADSWHFQNNNPDGYGNG